MQPQEILTFWFETCTPKQWFIKDPAFDALLREKFLEIYEEAAAGKVALWRNSPEGRLAEILALDQFARNMFRDTPKAFATDPLALSLAQEGVGAGDDMRLEPKQRHFFYMPYMHSESQMTHVEAMHLFEKLGDLSILRYEQEHKAIIDRFGRYPSRNSILGRTSTPEELEFLKEHPGF